MTLPIAVALVLALTAPAHRDVPDRPPRSVVIRPHPAVRGIATWMPERFGVGYLALPGGRGIRVRICGAGGCVTMTSTDAGPSLAGQRMGRVADIGVRTWERVCRLPRSRGVCWVTVARA